ncbi:MAG TPA: SURF1 family protein [Ilumatobacteraceae bacterium]|nr:SURF1 family protein [Ilumatobacteraceae bacterium]
MYRFLLRPKWIAFHLVCLAMVVAMINLGFWQLRRLDQKQTFNDAVRAAASAPVVPYDDSVDPYQRVEATGTYLDREFEVVNVSQDGSSGHDQVAALQLDDGTLLLVNRGFAAGGQALPPLPEGVVTVDGRVRASQSAGRGQPRDDGSQELTEIRRVDVPVLAQQFDDDVQRQYLEATAENGEPIAGLAPIKFPTLDEGPHLSYAIQWFIFTICVVAGWVLVVRRAVHERQVEAGVRAPSTKKKPLIPEQYL